MPLYALLQIPLASGILGRCGAWLHCNPVATLQ